MNMIKIQHQLQKQNKKKFDQFFTVYLACMATCEFRQCKIIAEQANDHYTHFQNYATGPKIAGVNQPRPQGVPRYGALSSRAITRKTLGTKLGVNMSVLCHTAVTSLNCSQF
jgi:hypothetical protein